MEQKNFQLLVSAMCFIIGGLFIIANTPDITADVIGASGPEAGLVSIFGLVLLVASGVYFMATMTLDEQIDRERNVRGRSHPTTATDHISHDYTDKEDQKYEEKKE